jgi:hypothetical protein
LIGAVQNGPLTSTLSIGNFNLTLIDAGIGIEFSAGVMRISPSSSFIVDRSVRLKTLVAIGGAAPIVKFITGLPWSVSGKLDAMVGMSLSSSTFDTARYGYPIVRIRDNNLFGAGSSDIRFDMVINSIGPQLTSLFANFSSFHQRITSMNFTSDFSNSSISNGMNSLYALVNFTKHVGEYWVIGGAVVDSFECCGGYPSFDEVLFLHLQFVYGKNKYPNETSLDLERDIMDIVMLFTHEPLGNETYDSMFGPDPTFDTYCKYLFLGTDFEAREVFGPKLTARALIHYVQYRSVGHCRAPATLAVALDMDVKEVILLCQIFARSYIY